MQQLWVVAEGNLSRQHSQCLNLGFNLGGHRVLPWGILQTPCKHFPVINSLNPYSDLCGKDHYHLPVQMRKLRFREVK